MSPRAREMLAWAPPALYMGLIALLSSQPGQIDLRDVPWQDKGAHFIEFGGLCVLTCRSLARTLHDPRVVRVVVFAWLITVGWGYLDEVHQAFVPGRHSDIWDVVADALGGLAGATAYALVRIARDLRSRDSS